MTNFFLTNIYDTSLSALTNPMKCISYKESYLNQLSQISKHQQIFNHEQQHSKDRFTLLHTDTNNISTNNNNNKNNNSHYNFDSQININQPESKVVKVNLDTTKTSIYNNNKNSHPDIMKESKSNNSNSFSVKQLIYKKINDSKIALNIKAEDQLKQQNDKTNTNVYVCDRLMETEHESNEYKFNTSITDQSEILNFQNSNCLLEQISKEAKRDQFETEAMYHNNSLNSICLSSFSNSSSGDSAIYMEAPTSHYMAYAYENLTYLSSDEDSTQYKSKLDEKHPDQLLVINSDVLKKTLKSIKRKDRLKKNTNSDYLVQNKAFAKSMSDLTDANTNQVNQIQSRVQSVSSNEYEKLLRKELRNTVLSRSLRRAKSVYYRNIRSKSLEDLSGKERDNYLIRSASHLKMNGKNVQASSISSLNSCSSSTSNVISISSSHYRDLNDLNDLNSYETDSSEDELLDVFDWDANLSFSQIELNGFDSQNSSFNKNEEDDDEEYEILLDRNKIINCKLQTALIYSEPECLQSEPCNLNSFMEKESRFKFQSFEKIMKESETSNSVLNSGDNLNYLIKNVRYCRIQTETEIRILNNCSICSEDYVLDDDIALIECKHTFHKLCFDFWLSKSNNCPDCYMKFRSRQLLSSKETLL